MSIRIWYSCICLLALSSCIKNDVPYPYIPGNILEMEVEGQTGEAEIDATKGLVNITIGGNVDIDSLKVLKLKISEEAMMTPDSVACVKFVKFPRWSFDSLEALPSAANTCMRLGKPAKILLQTYQEYPWTIQVKQVIHRAIKVKNQVGEAIVDESNKTVLIYVTEDQKLDEIQIDSMELGGSKATVVPAPQTVTSFFRPQKFIVCRLGKYFEEWIVDVVQTASIGTPGEADVWARHATVVGGLKQGIDPGIEYRKESENTWTTLSAEAITKTSSTAFKAELTGLEDGTAYSWRIVANGQTSDEATFTTEKIEEVPNLNFDTWTQEGKNWYPNPVADNYEDPLAYWATGNQGVTSIGKSPITLPVEGTEAYKGKAAKLTTITGVTLVKSAAGNLFIGTYKTSMTNPSSSVAFGKPFSGARPQKLTGFYKYTPQPINEGSYPGDLTMDECHIYIRLWDAAKKEIGYGEFIGKEDITVYTPFSLDIAYSNKKAKPAYITIVATSSHYGGEFSGTKVIGQVGNGSTLWVDEFELLYE